MQPVFVNNSSGEILGMISYVSGVVKGVTGNLVSLDIGPLALELQMPHAATLQVGSQVTAQVYLHWNQEQGPSLYGFASALDKTLFLMIIDCPGIGPKLGITILSSMSSHDFLSAIQTGNDRALSSISGIGAKKAEQLILQLRDKVAKLIKSGIDLDASSQAGHWHTVSQALVSLNYTRAEIAAAMKHLSQTQSGSSLTFDQLMRHALSYLAKKS